MKRKKILGTIIGSAVCVTMAFAVASATACGHQHTYKDEWEHSDTEHWHAASCEHTDEKSDIGAHVYDNAADTSCNICGYTRIVPTTLDADDINDDSTIATYDKETVTAATVPAPNVVTKTDDGAALTEGSFETSYEFDAGNLETKTYTDGWTDGIFAITSGTEVRGRVKSKLYEDDTVVDAAYESKNSVKLGSSTAALQITVPQSGELTFYANNGSSGVGSVDDPESQTVVLTKPDKTTQEINYQAKGNASTVQRVKVNLDAAGTYSITRKSGTSDLMYAKFTYTTNNTPIESISVANKGKIDYLVGEQLDCTEIAVTATHADSGRISQVETDNLTIDTSNYNATQSGTYSIGISYTVKGNLTSATTTFTTSYQVNVYSFEELSIATDKIQKDDDSAAGNGVYFNHSLKQFYFVGDAFDTDGLSLKAKGKLGETYHEFALDVSKAEITGADTSTAGKKAVKIAYTANGVKLAQGVNIYVAEKNSELATANSVSLAVNKDFSTVNIGIKNTAGAYRFKTITQALNFLNAAGLNSASQKTIYLAEGTYWEKLEVTVPNVTILGAGEEVTKIEYDALYGVDDAGGFTHTTDSTATLNIRDSAVGFSIKDVTISNYYNTLESYTNAISNDHRALAMLVQADKVIVENCTLLGFQDTLELFTGRQFFKNCTILGTTDFIFGTNNTTYFYQCEIKAILNGSNGGYITAFKGNNKGTSTDGITYGAIFDDCDFTCESGVPDGKTSIGRTWGDNAAVMVMNSRLGKHVSKATTTNQGSRYVAMNGAPENAKFTEYNNIGDGAITASQAGVTVLDATAAANYSDFSVIFGVANGKVSYADVWNPVK